MKLFCSYSKRQLLGFRNTIDGGKFFNLVFLFAVFFPFDSSTTAVSLQFNTGMEMTLTRNLPREGLFYILTEVIYFAIKFKRAKGA